MPEKNNRLIQTTALILALIASNAFAQASIASRGDNTGVLVDTSDVGTHERGHVNSDQLLELGTSTPSALRLEGEQAMRFNNIERAIMVLQKSVEMAPEDMDGRILYAQALEKKLTKQKDRDPSLFNYVIKQWLYVAKKAEYLDQASQGNKHLENLTGTKPRKFEAPGKFLARVLIAEDGSTKVAFKHKSSKSDADKVE